MLFRKLRADEIECRISTVNQYGVGLLLYKDARCDMNILDETLGTFNWQRKHEIIDGRLYCSVGIKSPDGEWIWKQDVGTESYTEKEKGQASDSFKRACFNIGIGRELYTAPDMWVKANSLKTLKQDVTKWTCKDFFKVTRLDYNENKICLVEILNVKTGEKISFGEPSEAAERKEDIGGRIISQTKAEVLRKTCENYKDLGLQEEKLLNYYKVNSFSEMTESQFIDCMNLMQSYEKKRSKDGV